MASASPEYLAWRRQHPPGTVMPVVPLPKVLHNSSVLMTTSIVPQTISFHQIPAEVQKMILSMHIESFFSIDGEWEDGQQGEDITIASGWKPSGYRFDTASAHTKLFKNLDNIMEALHKSPSEKILTAAIACYHHFTTRFSDSLRKLPRVLTESKLSYISDFDLTLNEAMLNGHEKVLPDVLDVLRNHLPNLGKLYIRRNIDIDIWQEDKDPEMEPLDKYATLLRFLSFFTLRRREDFRLLLPADSGPPNETVWGVGLCQSISLLAERSLFSHPPDRQKLEQLLGRSIDKEAFRRWHSAEKFYNGSLTYPHLVGDEILNATAIRQATLPELGSRGPRAFIVNPTEGKHKNNILTPEIPQCPEISRMYELVHKRGYQTRAVRRDNFWPHRFIDDLILLCRQREFQARDRRIQSGYLIAYA